MTSNDDFVQIGKVLVLNAAALTVSFMGVLIEVLQVLLLLVTLGYTIYKWVELHKKNRKK